MEYNDEVSRQLWLENADGTPRRDIENASPTEDAKPEEFMTTETVGDCHFAFKADQNKVVEPVLVCKMRCNGCGVKIEFDVVARRVGEALMAWMQNVQEWASAAHHHVRPTCQCRTCDLQIPMPEGSKGVGEVARS